MEPVSNTIYDGTVVSAAKLQRSIAIFAAMEKPAQIVKTLQACCVASSKIRHTCDVLVNGNRGLADELQRQLPSMPGSDLQQLRLWFSAVPDKAHTWNWYFSHVWPQAAVSLFLDGYVEPFPDSFALLTDALAEHPHAFASSAVPTYGASAKKQRAFQLKINGINGNLFAMSYDGISRLRSSGFHLPRGIYRTDGTMQSYLKHSFDPRNSPFDRSRVVVVPQASYYRTPLSVWKWSDIMKQWRRIQRQRQGLLISAAIKHLLSVKKTHPRDIPETVRDLVGAWMQACPSEWRRMARTNPLLIPTARKALAFKDWPEASAAPECLLTV